MPPVRREQGDRFESSVNTRQDRNTLLTGGGIWTWDSGTGTLTWSASLVVVVGGGWAGGGTPAKLVISPSTQAGLNVDTCWYVVFDRNTGGGATLGVAGIADDLLDADDVLVLGVRGTDNRFYMRDGTVFADGDVSSLGTWSPSIDRVVVEGTGEATLTLPLTYVYGSGQLLVIVGGIVQELGEHYEEVDNGPNSTDITFLGDFIPGVDERIVCMTLTGGRGVPTANSRQDTYDTGNAVLVAEGRPLENRLESAADPEDILEDWGGEGAASDDLAHVRKDATWRGRAYQTRDSSDHAESWEQVSLGGHLIFWNTATEKAIRVRRGTGEIDFGTCDGTSFTITAQPAGGGVSGTQPGARVMCFSGTLDPALPTHIPWDAGTLGVPYGIQILAYNAAPTIAKYMAGEMSGFATGGSEVIVLYDETNGRIVVSGSLTGNDVVGANYQGQPYRMTVFY